MWDPEVSDSRIRKYVSIRHSLEPGVRMGFVPPHVIDKLLIPVSGAIMYRTFIVTPSTAESMRGVKGVACAKHRYHAGQHNHLGELSFIGHGGADHQLLPNDRSKALIRAGDADCSTPRRVRIDTSL